MIVQYSVNLNAVLHATAGTITAGLAVIQSADRSGWLAATSANMSAAGVTVAGGVSLDSTSSTNAAIRVQTDGMVPNEITALGIGTRTYVRANPSTARLERVSSVSGSDVILGQCNEAGDLFLSGLAGLVATGSGTSFRAANVTALRALLPTTTGDTCVLAGRTTAGDNGAGTFVFFLSDATTDDGNNNVRPTANNGCWKRITKNLFDLTDYGAKTDGTDCSAAWVAVINAIVAYGKPAQLRIPEGTYTLAATYPSGIALKASNLTISGAGQSATVIKASGSFTYMFNMEGAGPTNVVIENLTFDGNFTAYCILQLAHCQYVKVRNCTFKNAGYGGGLNPTLFNHVQVLDCSFTNGAPATSRARGIVISAGAQPYTYSPYNGGKDLRVSRCKFWALEDSLLGICEQDSTQIKVGKYRGENLVSDVSVESCEFDAFWWMWPIRQGDKFSGTVGTDASITDTTLVRTSGYSGALPSITDLSTARLLLPVTTQAGLGLVGNPTMTTFGAVGIATAWQKGQLYVVRCFTGGVCTHQAIVADKDNNDCLRIEGWHDPVTLQPMAEPNPSATTWGFYRVFLGKVASTATQTVTLGDGWFDGEGRRYTAATLTGLGTLTWEVCATRPNYSGVHFGYAIRYVTIRDSKFRNIWSDNISIYGDHARVIDNYISRSQDQGITINATPFDQPGSYNRVGQSVIRGNHLECIGSNGITTDNGCIVTQNFFRRCTWTVTVTEWIAAIVAGGENVIVTENIVDGDGAYGSRIGISVISAHYPCVRNNTVFGYTTTAPGSGAFTYGPCAIMCIDENGYRFRSFGGRIGPNNLDMQPVSGVPANPTQIRQYTVTAGTPTAGAGQVIGTPIRNDVSTQGTTDLTITGTVPTETLYRTLIKIRLGGARGTMTFDWSIDNGVTWSATNVTSAATNALGATGLTANWPLSPTTAYTTGDLYVCECVNGGSAVWDYEGAGAPALYAKKGSTYRRTDGGAGTCFYVKESTGEVNTGWVGK